MTRHVWNAYASALLQILMKYTFYCPVFHVNHFFLFIPILVFHSNIIASIAALNNLGEKIFKQ